ncbi:hypothetical protein JCM14469_14430 [Desulfatiferula olefinivorans]
MKVKSFQTCIAIVSAFLVGLCSCSGPDEKKAAFLEKGKRLYEEKDFTRARLEFRNAIQIDVNYADAYYYLGLTELADRNYQKAFAGLSKAETLSPDNLDIKIQLGRLYMAARQIDKARETIDYILTADPSSIQGRFLKVSLDLSESKFSEAEALLEKLKTQGALEPEWYILSSGLYSRKNEMEKAEAVLKDGCAAHKDNTTLRLALALHYKRLDNMEKLSGVLEELIRLEPDKEEHLFALADACFRMDRKDKALTLLYKTLDPDAKPDVQAEKIIRLADFLMGRKQPESAESVLKEGMARLGDRADLHLTLSRLYEITGRPDEGFAILEKALTLTDDEADPGLLRVKNRLAEIHLMKNEKDTAEAYVRQVLSASPKNVDALYLDALIMMGREAFEGAITNLRTVVAEKPDFENGYLNLIRAYMMNGQKELAYDAIRRGVDGIPGSRDLRMVLIRYHLSNKDKAGAEKELLAMVRDLPDDLDARIALGDFYLIEKKFDKALELYAYVKTNAPGREHGYVKTALVHETMGNLDKSRAELEAALTVSPDSPTVLSPMIKLLAEGKHYDKAAAICRDQIAKKKNEPLFQNILGRLHLAQKQYAPAEKAFLRATELQPAWNEPYLNLTRLYVAQGKQSSAISTFEGMRADDPDNLPASILLAVLYENGGKFEKAIDLYKIVVDRMPDNLDAMNNLAVLLGEYPKKEGDLDLAMAYARRVVDKRPEDPAARDTLAWLHYKMGNVDQASDILAKVLADRPDNPVINYHAGMVFFKQNKRDDARRALEKAVAGGKDYHGYREAEETLGKLRVGTNG